MALPDLLKLPQWKELCLRYRYNITAFATEVLGMDVTWQQHMLFQSIAFDGSRTSVSSGHGTGKSRSAGVVALWHLLFFEKSVMMFTAPSITQLQSIVWKEIAICLAKMQQGVFAWLADYVVCFTKKIYIKGHDKDWYVFAKTASKSNPTSIAGQHGDNYMLWADEAAGIDDKVLDVALNALTHADNRAVMTSQPARNAGLFYDTQHKLSHRSGGKWIALIFNGEDSPLVSDASIIEALQKYGSRDDPQYMIRVRGLFPDLSNEFLVTNAQSNEIYAGTCLFPEKHDQFGYIISVDVGAGRGRDDSVISVSKVWGNKHWGDHARRVEVVDIPLCNNKDGINTLFGTINECLIRYPNALVVLDDNGAGVGLGQLLKDHGIFYKSVKWGNECFSNENKKDYRNRRSQANVCLARAIAEGRFKMRTNKYKVKIQEQITKMRYHFDENARYIVDSKESLRKKGIRSPDVIDTFAFLFLEGVHYAEANENVVTTTQSDEDVDEWAALRRLAQARKAATQANGTD